jgi:hypothetical protein
MSHWDIHFLLGFVIGLVLSGKIGYALLGGLFSIVVDFDHIWIWVLQIEPPFVLPSIIFDITSIGRPFHTIYAFILYAIIITILAPVKQKEKSKVLLILIVCAIGHLWLDTFNPILFWRL